MNVPEEVRSFANLEILPTLVHRYETRRFSRDLWAGMAQAGLFGFLVPPEHGGSGMGPEGLLAAIDAFVEGGCDLGLCLSWLDHLIIHTHVINRFGSAEQKARYLPQLAGGKSIGALAASEPGTGADPARMKSTARIDGTLYRINAHKTFITNGPVADFIIVLARTGPRPGKEGISAFLLGASTPGYRVARELDFGFLNTSPHGELVFEDCPVPAANILGGIGDGHVRISRAVFGWERYILLYALVAHFRVMLDRLVREISGGPGFPGPELRRRIAAAHVTLEGLRDVTAQWACGALALELLDRRLMERLLFLGQSAQQWWDDWEEILEQVEPPADPVFRILLRDAALLRTNRGLFDLQLDRTARILFGEAAGPE